MEIQWCTHFAPKEGAVLVADAVLVQFSEDAPHFGAINLAIKTHEDWLEAHCYLNTDYLRELKKEALRRAA